jgi:predicted permease
MNLRRLFRRRQVEAEMAEEMRFHLEQRTADLAADGAPPDEASYAAQRRFGNLASIQEQAREARGWGWLERFLKDLSFAARQLVRSPGFSLLAIVTLGLGIGANTATFSMLNGLLLQPLPYPDTTQLDRVYRVTAQTAKGNLSAADFLELQRAKDGFGDIAAFTPANVSLADAGRPAEFAYAARCTANLLSLLGVRPQLGRNFRPGEDVPGRDRVVILSQRTWRNRYGAAPDIIGRAIRIDGEPHQVVGVLPPSFNDWRHLGMIDFFRPLAFSAEQAADRSSAILRVILRRAPARSPAEVAGLVANLGARLAAEFPEANAETAWRTRPLQDTMTPKSAAPMLGLMLVLSVLVLLIACSNLANLLLARTMARAREFAVRAALGASRAQLLRPMIAESLLLALAGGVCAVLLAFWFRDYMAVRTTGDNGEQVFVEIGWPVFGWAFGASLVTALAFSTVPALFALRLDLNHTLKSGGRGLTGGRGHRRFRQALIVGQFAVAMILLAAAGVQIRGLNELNQRRAGWESDHLITGDILLPAGVYSDAEKITAFHRLALERLAALPGVTTASISSFTPFFNWTDARKFIVEGRGRPPPGREPAAVVNAVTPHYFDTFGTRLLAGRAFDEGDSATAPKVFILGASTARALFGDADPVGRRIAPVTGAGNESPSWGEVIGVASDVIPAVNERNPVTNETNQIYQPMAQQPRRPNTIAVRTSGVAPAAMVDDIRATIAQLDQDLPVRQLQHADLTVERANYQTAVGRDIFATMALLGLGLASLGIYGVIARTMAQRTGEFAIRLALGASLGDLTRLVLVSGMKLALAGCTLGLAGALAVTRALGALNPNMRMNGVAASIGAILLLFAVALLACWLPARRASRINAIDALRAE